MPIDRDIIEKLLEELSGYLYDIDTMHFVEQDLLESRDIQHLLNHRLHTAVEICIDMATHIASALELPDRDSASDVIALLGKQGIIPKTLADEFQKAPRLRNVLVHGYAKIDYRFLFRDYKKDTIDIKNFAAKIKQYLDSLDKKI